MTEELMMAQRSGSLPPYSGLSIALLIQHGKEQIIGPVLEPAIGCRIERVDGIDTDQLSTVTREIPRAGPQVAAARKKETRDET